MSSVVPPPEALPPEEAPPPKSSITGLLGRVLSLGPRAGPVDFQKGKQWGMCGRTSLEARSESEPPNNPQHSVDLNVATVWQKV